ncbi:MAG: hypothetical protein FJ110_19055 [Deltaproteobacteria bacterium]|nr:hypothetical protein [Deltaproteobacteria bacterium]
MRIRSRVLPSMTPVARRGCLRVPRRAAVHAATAVLAARPGSSPLPGARSAGRRSPADSWRRPHRARSP